MTFWNTRLGICLSLYRFVVSFENDSFAISQWKPIFGTHGHWALRVLQRASFFCDTGHPFPIAISEDPWVERKPDKGMSQRHFVVYQQFDKPLFIIKWFVNIWEAVSATRKPAEICFFTFWNSMVINKIHQIKGWSMFVLWKNCKQDSESENILKCVFFESILYSKVQLL